MVSLAAAVSLPAPPSPRLRRIPFFSKKFEPFQQGKGRRQRWQLSLSFHYQHHFPTLADSCVVPVPAFVGVGVLGCLRSGTLFSLCWLSALLQHFYWPLSNFSDFRLVNWTFKVAASQNYHHRHSPHWTLVSVGGCQCQCQCRKVSLSHCRPSFFPSSLPFPFLSIVSHSFILHTATAQANFNLHTETGTVSWAAEFCNNAQSTNNNGSSKTGGGGKEDFRLSSSSSSSSFNTLCNVWLLW